MTALHFLFHLPHFPIDCQLCSALTDKPMTFTFSVRVHACVRVHTCMRVISSVDPQRVLFMFRHVIIFSSVLLIDYLSPG